MSYFIPIELNKSGMPTPESIEKNLENQTEKIASYNNKELTEEYLKKIHDDGIDSLSTSLPRSRNPDILDTPVPKGDRIAQFLIFLEKYDDKNKTATYQALYTYDDFFIENIAEARKETLQILQTFESEHVYAFGDDPKFISYSGRLLNFANPEQKSRFLQLYDIYLRASQALRYGIVVFLYYDDWIIKGYMITSDVNESGITQEVVPFGFTMYVMDKRPVTFAIVPKKRKKENTKELNEIIAPGYNV